nr:ribosomal protein S13 [Acorus tatarinowii]
MSYLSGALNKKNEQVRIALTKIYGIGPKKAMQLCSRLGLSGNIKMNELTKFQMDQIDERIGQDHVVHWELQRVLLADIEQLISIGCYRGTKKIKSV